MYKKGKVHGEEYWSLKILPIVVFSNVQMLAIQPFLIHEDVPKYV